MCKSQLIRCLSGLIAMSIIRDEYARNVTLHLTMPSGYLSEKCPSFCQGRYFWPMILPLARSSLRNPCWAIVANSLLPLARRFPGHINLQPSSCLPFHQPVCRNWACGVRKFLWSTCCCTCTCTHFCMLTIGSN